MPNKIRYIIYPDRTYIIKLGDREIEISGEDIVNLGLEKDKNE